MYVKRIVDYIRTGPTVWLSSPFDTLNKVSAVYDKSEWQTGPKEAHICCSVTTSRGPKAASNRGALSIAPLLPVIGHHASMPINPISTGIDELRVNVLKRRNHFSTTPVFAAEPPAKRTLPKGCTTGLLLATCRLPTEQQLA